MKRLIAIAAALAAIVICSEGTTQAQTQLHRGGFPYPGRSVQQGFGGANLFGSFQRPREQAPYFAQFPPVYYSHVVKRPYGISPYAAPAGVVPAEFFVPAPVSKPMVVNNPYFKGGNSIDGKLKIDTKVKSPVKAKKNKVAGWQSNPFFQPQLASN